MLSKKEIKDIQSLGLKKQREESGLFVAEGPKTVKELVQLIPDRISGVYALQAWIDQNQTITGVNVVSVSEQELGRISQLQQPNQVVAVIQQQHLQLPSKISVALYLDTIQDPGNFGTIIRIADWFGVKHVVCSAGCVDLYNPKVVQSTMASIARVDVSYDVDGTWIRNQNLPLIATTLEGSSVYDHTKIEEGILLIGNESKGLSHELIQLATEKITIPRKGNAESLNAAVATGIILSHLLSI
jgi:RNA methyltransferase, TrmH family